MSDEYLVTALKDLAEHYGPWTVLSEARLLFADAEPSNPSRVSDPATSHASGARKAVRDVARFKRGSQCAKLLANLIGWPKGQTQQEAAMWLLGAGVPPSQFDGCRRRMSDLARAGYIEDSGERRCNDGSPDESIVWTLTSSGRAALDRLERTGWSKPAPPKDRTSLGTMIGAA